MAEVLEFEALRALVGHYVRSALGRDELARVAPSSDRAFIESALAETAEGLGYLRAAAQPQSKITRITFGDLADSGSTVARESREPQSFRLLHKLGTEPKVYYRSELAWVRELAERGGAAPKTASREEKS